jgi:hypothetical protein
MKWEDCINTDLREIGYDDAINSELCSITVSGLHSTDFWGFIARELIRFSS